MVTKHKKLLLGYKVILIIFVAMILILILTLFILFFYQQEEKQKIKISKIDKRATCNLIINKITLLDLYESQANEIYGKIPKPVIQKRNQLIKEYWKNKCK